MNIVVTIDGTETLIVTTKPGSTFTLGPEDPEGFREVTRDNPKEGISKYRGRLRHLAQGMRMIIRTTGSGDDLVTSVVTKIKVL